MRAHVAASRERTQGWTRQRYRDTAALADHHAAVSAFWTPGAQAYAGLGDWYVENPEFRARYDAVDPRLAQFPRDAMAAYAAARLG